jgi:hypothetical protein
MVEPSKSATPFAPPLENPLRIKGAAVPAGLAYLIGNSRILLACTLAAFCVLVRLRRSSSQERQQLKWMVSAGILLALVVGGEVGLWPWLHTLDPSAPYPGELLLGIPSSVAYASIPAAAGIAILRYRLYEIDLIINRTLVYGSLTTTLVAVYFGAIVVLQRLFVLLTGEKSTLAVVASTLAIAALFNPLRRRIQSFVDRRFYRSKYDAAKALEGFSARLRNETDLETLHAELVGVVRETMQPSHVSLWLRPDRAPQRERAV